MPSDQILSLMSFMREIEAPLKTYNHQLRRTWRTETDSPENLAAQERGEAALLDIETAIRRWVAEHPEDTTGKPADGTGFTGNTAIENT